MKANFGNAKLSIAPGVPAGSALLLENKPNDSSAVAELLTIPEVAQLLKVSVPTVRRLLDQRTISFLKVGGSVRFTRDDVLSYLARHRVESVGE